MSQGHFLATLARHCCQLNPELTTNASVVVQQSIVTDRSLYCSGILPAHCLPCSSRFLPGKKYVSVGSRRTNEQMGPRKDSAGDSLIVQGAENESQHERTEGTPQAEHDDVRNQVPAAEPATSPLRQAVPQEHRVHQQGVEHGEAAEAPRGPQDGLNMAIVPETLVHVHIHIHSPSSSLPLLCGGYSSSQTRRVPGSAKSGTRKYSILSSKNRKASPTLVMNWPPSRTKASTAAPNLCP